MARTNLITNRVIAWVAVLAIVVACPVRALAWGREGHQIIARIAADRLAPKARARVEELLGGPAAESLANASTWADEVRPDRRSTAPWHYVNIELGSAGYVATRDCPAGDCVVEQVNREADRLALGGRTGIDVTEDLKFLVHFIGDIHQPLHCADNHDRGGNEVIVEIGDRQTNLHAVWDHDEVAALGTNPTDVAARLNQQISGSEAAKWSKGTPADWANGSFAIARDRIYQPLAERNSAAPVHMTVSEIQANSAVAALQLKRAGVRLAVTLNRVFGGQERAQAAPKGDNHMKHTAAAVALVGAMVPALAATVTANDAQSHIGQTVTVEGVVSEVHHARSGVTFLDFGGHYPDQSFTGVIFSEDTGAFQNVDALSGKTVDVTGTVQLYHGKPEIILRSANQLKAK